MKLRRTLPAVGIATTAMLVTAVALAPGAGATDGSGHVHDGNVLFVATNGMSSNTGSSCDQARYATIQAAVDAAPAGATIVVCQGTYNEDVVISNPLSLRGQEAVIVGSSTANGQCDQLGPSGPGSAPCLAGITIKSSHVKVEGFTVEKAIGEGILATGSLKGGSIADITIEGNKVVGNNVGGIPPTAKSPYPQCVEMGQIPGDCGEGIHLMGVADSRVLRNYVTNNEGGVLLTDEFGPTHHNIVAGNVVTANPFDCGVTVPGHNPFALDKNGHRRPSVAGVYDNAIVFNWITDNGLKGEGAGVLFANAAPGSASYDNVVAFNYLAGNELSGVTMHAHTLPPGQFEDLSGNKVVHNLIGTNNVGSSVAGPGDALDGPPAQDFETTGVLVFSASVPVDVTVEENVIVDNHFGVWLGVNGNVHATVTGNIFHNVTDPVFTFS